MSGTADKLGDLNVLDGGMAYQNVMRCSSLHPSKKVGYFTWDFSAVKGECF